VSAREYVTLLFNVNDDPAWRKHMEWAMREDCAKRNPEGHRKLPGTSTCLDCGTDLDR
jgi:hypothetical protein